MSALSPKADIVQRKCHVRLCQKQTFDDQARDEEAWRGKGAPNAVTRIEGAPPTVDEDGHYSFAIAL